MIAYLTGRLRRTFTTTSALSCFVVAGSIAAPSHAQISSNAQSTGRSAVCVEGSAIVVAASDACGGAQPPSIPLRRLDFGTGPTKTTLSGDGSATFNNSVSFNGQTDLNGPTNVNGSLTLSGSISTNGITNSGGLTNSGQFINHGNVLIENGLGVGNGATFGGEILASKSIAATGSISTSANLTAQGVLNAKGGSMLHGNTQVIDALTVSNGAAVDMGGNRVQNVGAPIFDTDAANKSYVDVAVAGVSAGVAQAAADNMRQDQELTDVRAVNAQQAQQIAGVQADNTRQDQELTDVRAVNTQQAGQIAGVQADNTRQDQELTDVRAVNTQQAQEIAEVQTVNTRQDEELTDVRTVNTQQAGQIATIQALDAQQAQQIGALQQGQAALFDLAKVNQRDISKANEGVAMALAMESPALPPGTSFALSGGIGYFQNQAAATTAMTARIGHNASFSAGLGVGFHSGEVGARSGFQVAW